MKMRALRDLPNRVKTGQEFNASAGERKVLLHLKLAEDVVAPKPVPKPVAPPPPPAPVAQAKELRAEDAPTSEADAKKRYARKDLRSEP